ncbi:hypothetical protein [Actinomadura livida]|uniref:Drug/metabolite transporter (DMT)-like permease n=1 Tax=Actinomadura livida TaxID=79909 RepID=A0A7W7I8J2_9ACTN|nr:MULTISPECIES: hypothetical protein [Actinomadura]MBB4772487.1 drug/metabolite transporter (DMT)-like permease [Actinomadura catellatispora]GGU22639.1 hypothetical protein GCM10010208_54450 [Actinomadura livida]
MSVQYQLLAFLSTGVYFAGLAFFKKAAAEMPPLQGSRPWHLARTLLTSGAWVTGAAVLGAGAAVQVAALTGLSLSEALPLFLAGLGVLVALAVLVLGERLTAREWGCAGLLAAAAVLLLSATPGGDAAAGGETPPAPLVVAVALPSLLVPCIMFLASDRARRGAHARPLTGVALAINVGLLTGTNELMLRGAAPLTDGPGALAGTPYLYIFAVAAPLAMGQLQIALQRSRLVVVGLVATATAKTYLLLLATPLYGDPWPSEGDRAALALALTILAIAAVPHHEPRDTAPRDTAVRDSAERPEGTHGPHGPPAAPAAPRLDVETSVAPRPASSGLWGHPGDSRAAHGVPVVRRGG